MNIGRKILIGPSTFAATDKSPWQRLEAAGLEVIDNPLKRRLTRDEVKSLLKPDVVGLLAGLEPLDADVFAASQLKVISRVGAGMDNVDQPAAIAAGIRVFNTPYGPTQAVAEMTLGCLLAVMRQTSDMDAELHRKRWTKRIGLQLHGKTVAIVGYGRIGRRFADLLAPFAVKILVVDPYLPTTDTSVTHPRHTLAEVLPIADVISLHLAGEDRIFDAATIARMKPRSILLNAARGGLVDDVALAAALRDGRLAGAWMDAFPVEPYTGPLTECPTALLTPHVCSYTEECRLGMEMEAVDNLLLGLRQAGVLPNAS